MKKEGKGMSWDNKWRRKKKCKYTYSHPLGVTNNVLESAYKVFISKSHIIMSTCALRFPVNLALVNVINSAPIGIELR
jgi:hypothetical protein